MSSIQQSNNLSSRFLQYPSADVSSHGPGLDRTSLDKVQTGKEHTVHSSRPTAQHFYQRCSMDRSRRWYLCRFKLQSKPRVNLELNFDKIHTSYKQNLNFTRVNGTAVPKQVYKHYSLNTIQFSCGCGLAGNHHWSYSRLLNSDDNYAPPETSMIERWRKPGELRAALKAIFQPPSRQPDSDDVVVSTIMATTHTDKPRPQLSWTINLY